jgi:hypothetical protein
MWRVFLKKMQTLNRNFALVRPGPAGFQYATPEDGSRFTRDEELGHGSVELICALAIVSFLLFLAPLLNPQHTASLARKSHEPKRP